MVGVRVETANTVAQSNSQAIDSDQGPESLPMGECHRYEIASVVRSTDVASTAVIPGCSIHIDHSSFSNGVVNAVCLLLRVFVRQ